MTLKYIDNSASQTKMWTKYLNCKLRNHKTLANMHFNKQCLQMKVITKYSTIKMKNTSKAAIKTKKEAKIIRIKNEI